MLMLFHLLFNTIKIPSSSTPSPVLPLHHYPTLSLMTFPRGVVVCLADFLLRAALAILVDVLDFALGWIDARAATGCTTTARTVEVVLVDVVAVFVFVAVVPAVELVDPLLLSPIASVAGGMLTPLPRVLSVAA